MRLRRLGMNFLELWEMKKWFTNKRRVRKQVALCSKWLQQSQQKIRIISFTICWSWFLSIQIATRFATFWTFSDFHTTLKRKSGVDKWERSLDSIKMMTTHYWWLTQRVNTCQQKIKSVKMQFCHICTSFNWLVNTNHSQLMRKWEWNSWKRNSSLPWMISSEIICKSLSSSSRYKCLRILDLMQPSQSRICALWDGNYQKHSNIISGRDPTTQDSRRGTKWPNCRWLAMNLWRGWTVTTSMAEICLTQLTLDFSV